MVAPLKCQMRWGSDFIVPAHKGIYYSSVCVFYNQTQKTLNSWNMMGMLIV